MEVKQRRYAEWLFTVVYANLHVHEHEILWTSLHQFAAQCDRPWLLARDFNETVSLDERNPGGPDMLRRYTRFKHWIENSGLINLGFSGPKFIWTRGQNRDTVKQACLDRALCNVEWRTRFQEGVVRLLLQSHSDHVPLLIST